MSSSTYRATLTAPDGTTQTRPCTQDEWDALVDAHEVRDSAFPAGVRERQRKDGTWVVDAEWDTRPRKIERHVETDAELDARRRAQLAEEHATIVAAHRKEDAREERRSYYLRTGR